MRTLIRPFFLLVFFPFVMNGQVRLTESKHNNTFLTYSSDTISYINSDTAKKVNFLSRYYSVLSFAKENTYNTSIVGLGFSTNLIDKLTFISMYDYIGGRHNSLLNQYRDSLLVFPNFSLDNKRWQFNISCKLNKFIKTDFGKGKHFIGDGYRSLFLSLEHSDYPYLKLTTEFERVKFYNLYATLADIRIPDENRKKYASIHFLDFELVENINVGIFEAVIWQAQSEDYNRGYDIEYLNPVVFYRPVEFSKHSPDNVLMGTSFNAKYKTSIIYGQVLLDDLNVSRQKDRDHNYSGGFFQNKFGYQLGCRFSLQGFNILTEYNQVQPYTYAHKEPMQSYTHKNQALAHSLGANFKELIFLADYNIGNWKYRLKLTAAKVGLDSTHTHYGQNIFISDFEAEGDNQEYSYGNFNGQGELTHINTIYSELGYSLNQIHFFGSIYFRMKKSNLSDNNSLWYSIGVRSFPFSIYQDY